MSSRRLILAENTTLKFRIINSLHREVWIHEINEEREVYGEFHHLYEKLRKYPTKFFEYTRMSINTFDVLLSLLENRLSKETTGWRKPISPRERLIVALRFLATGNSFRSLSFEFRMGKSTVAAIVRDTCAAIWDELQEHYMPVPTREQLQLNVKEFYTRWDFPNCFGAIDGKHCKIKCPDNSGSLYFCYKKHFSIVLQAVADADDKFIVIEVGGAGRQSDGGTLSASTLYNLLESNSFNVPEPQCFPGSLIESPCVLIGDEAYPLKTYLMRPYPRTNLTPEKMAYNERLSRARKCVECAFGILRAKWRILAKEIETNVDLAISIIKAACILHNFVRTLDGNRDPHFQEISTIEEVSDQQKDGNQCIRRNNNSSTVQAKNIRTAFTNYFRDNPIINNIK